MHYRRALAHEGLGLAEPAVRKAVRSFACAVDAAKDSVSSAGGVTPFMRAECARLGEKLASARRDAKRALLQTYAARPVAHPLRSTWAALPAGQLVLPQP